MSRSKETAPPSDPPSRAGKHHARGLTEPSAELARAIAATAAIFDLPEAPTSTSYLAPDREPAEMEAREADRRRRWDIALGIAEPDEDESVPAAGTSDR